MSEAIKILKKGWLAITPIISFFLSFHNYSATDRMKNIVNF